jgi:hypothetical protein
MTGQSKKMPPALKHAGFSSKSVFPGEEASEYENLRRGIVTELKLDGALEVETGNSVAHLLWRQKNLGIFGIAQRIQKRMGQIRDGFLARLNGGAEKSSATEYEENFEKKWQAAEARAREEFGELYGLVELGDEATLEGLTKKLAIEDRLDSMIDRKLRRLLLIRGLKSLPAEAVPQQKIS